VTLLEHVQQTRADVTWITGPDINGNYDCDLALPNQSEIVAAVASWDPATATAAAALKATITERRLWAEDMMERLKEINVQSNLTLAQSIWVHQRLRKLEFTVAQPHADAIADLQPLVGMTFQIDLLNLVVSGDIETAFAALLCCTPDDMSQPYHALSADMIAWIMGEISSYLGWS